MVKKENIKYRKKKYFNCVISTKIYSAIRDKPLIVKYRTKLRKYKGTIAETLTWGTNATRRDQRDRIPTNMYDDMTKLFTLPLILAKLVHWFVRNPLGGFLINSLFTEIYAQGLCCTRIITIAVVSTYKSMTFAFYIYNAEDVAVILL